MQRVVVLGGLGDTYLLCTLYAGICEHHGPTKLVIKTRYEAVAQLFPGRLDYELSDEAYAIEADKHFQQTYFNRLGCSDNFYPHPCMAHTEVRLCEATTRAGRFSQADMFRLICRLPLDTQLWRPHVYAVPRLGTVLLVEAFTWPNTQPGFYLKLKTALEENGWSVTVNDDKLPLVDLFALAATSEWVIGPQCGLMSIFIHGQWPCRKTLATPDIDGRKLDYWSKTTFPYAYAQTFSGMDFDIEEYKITDDHAGLIRTIMEGPNALRIRPHDTQPVLTIDFPLTPGDLLDRYAVLVVKRNRFSDERRAAVERDFQRHAEASRNLLTNTVVAALFSEMVQLHNETFDLLEKLVPAAIAGEALGMQEHSAAIRANKSRVLLRQKADALLRGAYTEVKSYYG